MSRLLLVVCVFLLFLVSSGSAQDSEPIGPRMEDGSFGDEPPRDSSSTSSSSSPKPEENGTIPGTGVDGDNDPRIDPEEIVAPAMDSRDPAWKPAYEWHSGEKGDGRGAASLDCGDRRTCNDYKDAEAAKAANRTAEAQQ